MRLKKWQEIFAAAFPLLLRDAKAEAEAQSRLILLTSLAWHGDTFARARLHTRWPERKTLVAKGKFYDS